jgi:hypothetical protein
MAKKRRSHAKRKEKQLGSVEGGVNSKQPIPRAIVRCTDEVRSRTKTDERALQVHSFFWLCVFVEAKKCAHPGRKERLSIFCDVQRIPDVF